MCSDPTDLTIDFYTRALAASSGTSRAAIDILSAMSGVAAGVRVLSWGPGPLPAVLTREDGAPMTHARFAGAPSRARAQLCVEALPAGAVLPLALAGVAPPLSPLKHALWSLRTWRVRAAQHEPPRASIPRLALVNGIGAHALAACAARTSNIQPLARVLIVHESPRHFSATTKISRAQAVATLRDYDHCVFVSEVGMHEWCELAQLPAQRVSYIPNCVDESRIHALSARSRAELRAECDRERRGVRARVRQVLVRPPSGALRSTCPTDVHSQLRVVCVGAISPRKGQDLMLAAVAALSQRLPQLHVEFIGPARTAFARSLMRRASTLGLGERVTFTGALPSDRVYAHVRAADALVLASRAEAFPLATLEAMALGTCVIAAAVDGVPEQVTHGQTGLLFAREDVEGLAFQLEYIATDLAVRERLAIQARQHYEMQFSRLRHAARWTETIERIVAVWRSR